MRRAGTDERCPTGGPAGGAAGRRAQSFGVACIDVVIITAAVSTSIDNCRACLARRADVRDPQPDVRQSAYALVGDMAKT